MVTEGTAAKDIVFLSMQNYAATVVIHIVITNFNDVSLF